MAGRVPISRDDLEQHLKEQLQFLQASANAYDQGLDGEAKRMATTLRVLFYDSGNSKSLLGQLDRLSGKFLSTAFPNLPGNVSSHGGLVMVGMKGKETKYLAMLDGVPFKNWIGFEDWWNEVVFVDDQRREITRRDLVRVAANQDGGAHVDPSLDETYEALAKRNSLGWVYTDGKEDMAIPLPERAALRQITHETLVSLLPDYSKRVEHKVDMLVGAAAVFDSPTPPKYPEVEEPGRNDPCPCGSGDKYKKCHGRPSSGRR